MVRVNGSLYFGAVEHVAKAFAGFDPRQKHLVVLASGINFIDVAGAEMLVHESRRRRALGGGLYFYRVKDEVRRLLERGGYLQALGPENLFPVKHKVIPAIYPKFDIETCRRCKNRIFLECQVYLPNGEQRADSPQQDSS
jgi:SulP family sulfate permease